MKQPHPKLWHNAPAIAGRPSASGISVPDLCDLPHRRGSCKYAYEAGTTIADALRSDLGKSGPLLAARCESDLTKSDLFYIVK